MRAIILTAVTALFLAQAHPAQAKALLINNGSSYANFTTYFTDKGVAFDVIDDDAFTLGDESGYEFVVLSGGSSSLTSSFLAEEYKLIAAAPLPIYGICQGHQMIAREYGGTVTSLGVGTIQQVMNVHLHDLDELGLDFQEDSLDVWENHSFGLLPTALPSGFTVYGESKYCIEMIKHATKPLLGTQFHPENNAGDNRGDIVFDWFIDVMVAEFWSVPRITCDNTARLRVGEALNLEITYTNPGGGTAALDFTAPLPSWLAVQDGSLYGTADTVGTDTVSVVLTVNDTAYDTLTLVITVLPANLANGETHYDDSDNFYSANPVDGLWDGYVGSADGMNPGNTGIDSLWVEFDLGEPYSLEQVRLFGDGDGTWKSTLYSVRTKLDAAAAWTVLIDRADCGGTQWYETGVDRDARYIRLTVIGDTVAHATQVREFEVYGSRGTTGVRGIPLVQERHGRFPGTERIFDVQGRRVNAGIPKNGPTGIYLHAQVKDGTLIVKKQLELRRE